MAHGKASRPITAAGDEPRFDLAGGRINREAIPHVRIVEDTGPHEANPFYVASDIKRFRRTKADIARIRASIMELLSNDNPQTVRQVYYALTVRGVIEKNETEYQRTVVRLLGEMREGGQIPFEWIADNTRWMRKPSTFTGLESCLASTANFYRRDLWAAMPVYVEIWCEKDALAKTPRSGSQLTALSPLAPRRGDETPVPNLHGAARVDEWR